MTTQLTEQKLIFASAVEGLFHNALQGRMTPGLKERLATQGLKLDGKLLPAYTSEVWHRCLEEVVRELWPRVPKEEGYRQLGRQLVVGFRDTLLGRALEVVARAVGVRRLLERMEKNIRNGDNHTRIRFEVVDERHVRMEVSDVTDHPSYYQGILEASTELAGGKEVEVRMLAHHPPGATYSVRWR
ncbi:MAG: DUF2378 family protein [Myxococcaceae bacterium]|nr:DUF2378 family protein [Myxococcaceae bacterium]MCI0670602.1 DUF2378 family protein [Myxococcaceae bacterium]